MSILVLTPLASARSRALSTGETEMLSEQELIASAKSGKREAFGELCDRHAKKIFRVTLRITRNREDAEDAVQDAFLSAFVHLKDFDERAKFATWLTRIAINAALGKLRKKRGMRELPMDEPGPAEESGHSLKFPTPLLTPKRHTTARNERKSSSRPLTVCVPEPERSWSLISCRNVRRMKPRRFWEFPPRPSRRACSMQEPALRRNAVVWQEIRHIEIPISGQSCQRFLGPAVRGTFPKGLRA